MQNEKQMLLTEALPALATELRQLLTEQAEFKLAAQVSGLKVFNRCRCGDDF